MAACSAPSDTFLQQKPKKTIIVSTSPPSRCDSNQTASGISGAIHIGAFDGPSLIGVAGLEREAMAKLSHKAGLWGMYIAPSARGRGIGAELIQTALNYAASAWGVRQVNLRVNTRNQSAVALYLKLGFVQFGLEHDSLLINGEYHDEYEMAYVVRSEA
ncbi:GNAT family N-acetyltransferase [Dokdonella sp.]|uniref:GNAT family N-acetyltransferase n=1 Tax=Dokdonella sp. TaxID=2291710 RepID=UPI003783BDD7